MRVHKKALGIRLITTRGRYMDRKAGFGNAKIFSLKMYVFFLYRYVETYVSIFIYLFANIKGGTIRVKKNFDYITRRSILLDGLKIAACFFDAPRIKRTDY